MSCVFQDENFSLQGHSPLWKPQSSHGHEADMHEGIPSFHALIRHPIEIQNTP